MSGGDGPTVGTAAREPDAHAGSTAASSERCLDCGSPVLGAYCQSCGQRHGPPVESFGSLVRETITDLGGMDGRIFRTLEPLLTRPGFLTDEYLAGRHTRYVPPLRLYLVCSVFYFAVFFWSDSTRFFFFWVPNDPDMVALVRRLPQLMFLLLPVFALVLAALYRKRRRLYTAHAVFALHFHAFAFLVLPITAAVQPLLRRMLVAGTLGSPLGRSLIGLSFAAESSVVLYLYLALRRSYGGSRLGTALSAVGLMVGYMAFLLTLGLLTVPSLRQIVWASLTVGS